jgi:hypothetical protein
VGLDIFSGGEAFVGGEGRCGSLRRLCEELIEIDAGVPFPEVGDAFGAVLLSLLGLHDGGLESLLKEDVKLVGLVCLHKKYYILRCPSTHLKSYHFK